MAAMPQQDKQIMRWKVELVAAAAEPYRAAGRFAWHFARGKLGGDPVFAGLLRHGLIPAQSRILDLGCGQGLLAAWLRAAHTSYQTGNWPQDWPSAAAFSAYRGIELMPKDVQRAAVIQDGNTVIEQGDIRTANFSKADVVVILDVLHYMNLPAQNDVLRRVRAALGDGGRFIMRVGDAAAGVPFGFSYYIDIVVAAARGRKLERLHCRTLKQWTTALMDLGFTLETVPMSQGTPFANVLLVAQVA
jgi:SAM-dependent methyltransferase